MTTQLTLFAPPPAAPAATVPSGRYFRDGQFVLPDGERQPPKGLFCVMDPAGAPRDALRVLVVYVLDRDRYNVAIEVPALNRRWDAAGNFSDNALSPSHAAILAWASAELGLSPEAVRPLCYTTCAWKGEDRAVVRDEPHIGPVRKFVEQRSKS